MKMTIEQWGNGCQNSGISITLEKADGEKLNVSFSDGEPEDMIIARDLNDATRIKYLIEAAYEAGKNNEELIIEYK